MLELLVVVAAVFRTGAHLVGRGINPLSSKRKVSLKRLFAPKMPNKRSKMPCFRTHIPCRAPILDAQPRGPGFNLTLEIAGVNSSHLR